MKIAYIEVDQATLTGPLADQAAGPVLDGNALEMPVPDEKYFASLEPQKIACLNWQKDFPYDPEVYFKAFHNGSCLFLEYSVSEHFTRALAKTDGEYVYEDSCVEFFMQVDGEDCYYNFEWNAAGTMYLTYRPGRASAEPAPKETVALVRRVSSLGVPPIAEFGSADTENKWTLRLAIPIKTLWHTDLDSFSGLRARANFFKCGDALSQPHYLSWSAIDTARPDYHRPEFFAPIEFEKK